jgi:hypothetical protein
MGEGQKIPKRRELSGSRSSLFLGRTVIDRIFFEPFDKLRNTDYA